MPMPGVLRRVLLAALACGLLAVSAGCDEPKKVALDAGADAATPNTMDPKLQAAVAAAASGSGPVAGPAASGGPPPTGVFAPGEADKAHPRGVPAKIEVFSDGADPKVALKTRTEAAPAERALL